MDISLVPVIDCAFNRAKSNLKVIEFGAWGIPSFASKVAPYAKTIVDGENGFFLNNREALSRLIEDKSERDRVGNNIYNTVKYNFDMEKNCHLWPKAWATIRDKYIKYKETGVKPDYELKSIYGLKNCVRRNDPCPNHPNVKFKKCKVCYTG
jgi:hypothetical protein